MQIKNKNIIVLLISIFYCMLMLIYINMSTVDVAYSDYIRLINSYLPNVANPKALLRADILTCIPIMFLERFINVNLFSYSIMFDRAIGVFGLFLINIFIARYIFDDGAYGENIDERCSFKLKLGYFILSSMIIFSLSNWELILNGSGFAHFLCMAFYIYSFIQLDNIYKIFQIDNFELTHKTVLKKTIFNFLASYTTCSLLFAGPYGMVPFICVIIFLLAIKFLTTLKSMKDIKLLSASGERNSKLIAKNSIVDKTLIICAIMPFICFMLYVISNHFAVYEYSDASSVSLFSILGSTFPIKFILKAFASFIFGVESFALINISEFLNKKIIYAFGAFVIFLYCYCTYLNIKYKIYKHTLFPMLLMLWSLGNVGIIFLSRYIFLNPDYGASSRYYLQYMLGVLGFILTFYHCIKINNVNDSKNSRASIIIVLAIAVILVLNITALKYEMEKSVYRKENYVKMKEAALSMDSYTDEELTKIFEYRKGGKYIRDAFDILKENNLNIFTKKSNLIVN